MKYGVRISVPIAKVVLEIATTIIWLACICFSTNSCEKGDHYDIWEPPPFESHIFGTSGYQGVTPFVFLYDFTDRGISLIKKIEVDFGDGAGYEDVTDACFAWWKSEGEQPFHTYNDSGTYSISTRLKLTSNAPLLENNVITVYVFPPDEGDGA